MLLECCSNGDLQDESVKEYLATMIEESETTFEDFLDIACNFIPELEAARENSACAAMYRHCIENPAGTVPKEDPCIEVACENLLKVAPSEKVIELLNICPLNADEDAVRFLLEKVHGNEVGPAAAFILDKGMEEVSIIFKTKALEAKKKAEPSPTTELRHRSEKLIELLNICPLNADEDAIRFLLEKVHGNQIEPAATFILDRGMEEVSKLHTADLTAMKEKQEKELQQSQADDVRAKKQLMARFDEFYVVDNPSSKTHQQKEQKKALKQATKNMSADKNSKQLRYFDGQIVSRKGEKFHFIDDGKPEWDGGSRGRVKTKGKRGPGWV